MPPSPTLAALNSSPGRGRNAAAANPPSVANMPYLAAGMAPMMGAPVFAAPMVPAPGGRMPPTALPPGAAPAGMRGAVPAFVGAPGQPGQPQQPYGRGPPNVPQAALYNHMDPYNAYLAQMPYMTPEMAGMPMGAPFPPAGRAPPMGYPPGAVNLPQGMPMAAPPPQGRAGQGGPPPTHGGSRGAPAGGPAPTPGAAPNAPAPAPGGPSGAPMATMVDFKLPETKKITIDFGDGQGPVNLEALRGDGKRPSDAAAPASPAKAAELATAEATATGTPSRVVIQRTESGPPISSTELAHAEALPPKAKAAADEEDAAKKKAAEEEAAKKAAEEEAAKKKAAEEEAVKKKAAEEEAAKKKAAEAEAAKKKAAEEEAAKKKAAEEEAAKKAAEAEEEAAAKEAADKKAAKEDAAAQKKAAEEDAAAQRKAAEEEAAKTAAAPLQVDTVAAPAAAPEPSSAVGTPLSATAKRTYSSEQLRELRPAEGAAPPAGFRPPPEITSASANFQQRTGQGVATGRADGRRPFAAGPPARAANRAPQAAPPPGVSMPPPRGPPPGPQRGPQGGRGPAGGARGRPSMPPSPMELTHVEPLKRSENRWTGALPPLQDEAERVRLVASRQAKSILNKLTPQFFEPLKQQLLQIPVPDAQTLQTIVQVIFDKALDEPKFAPLYAKLCAEVHQLMPTFQVPVRRVVAVVPKQSAGRTRVA